MNDAPQYPPRPPFFTDEQWADLQEGIRTGLKPASYDGTAEDWQAFLRREKQQERAQNTPYPKMPDYMSVESWLKFCLENHLDPVNPDQRPKGKGNGAGNSQDASAPPPALPGDPGPTAADVRPTGKGGGKGKGGRRPKNLLAPKNGRPAGVRTAALPARRQACQPRI